MVGAIADWFTVGRPVSPPAGQRPHRRYCPGANGKSARNWPALSGKNFLSEAAISDAKLYSMDATRKVAGWLSQPENGILIAGQMAAGSAAMVVTR
ncbi:MAG: hypothetical protein U0401_25755 [Anaerolineae bacterium]